MITINEPGILSLAPDFDNPLELIKACHQRILFHCELLNKTISYIIENKLDNQAIDAARRISHYFNSAGKHHHEDEEQDIFPRLIKESAKLADIINTLKLDHVKTEALWKSINRSLSHPRTISALQLPELRKDCEEFHRLNRKHIQYEEENLFTVAPHLISSDDLKLIGQSMKKRRLL